MTEIELRTAEPEDAEALLCFGETLLAETTFLLRGPGERARSVDEMRQVIEGFARLSRHLLLNAWQDGRPVGEIVVMGGQFTRNRHVASLGLGVLRSHWRRGIGRRLMQAAEEFARDQSIHRLELTVMAHNAAAKTLYDRLGFEAEGMKRHSVLVDGRYIDELLMAKLLDASTDGPAQR